MRMRGRGIEEETERGDTRMREGKRAQEKVRKKRIKEGAWGKAREVERERREKDRKIAHRERKMGEGRQGEREKERNACLERKDWHSFLIISGYTR